MTAAQLAATVEVDARTWERNLRSKSGQLSVEEARNILDLIERLASAVRELAETNS